jgi:hypothetical protein
MNHHSLHSPHDNLSLRLHRKSQPQPDGAGVCHATRGRAGGAYSAGSQPSGRINPKAIAAMAELGYDLSTHASKSLNVSDEQVISARKVILVRKGVLHRGGGHAVVAAKPLSLVWHRPSAAPET